MPGAFGAPPRRLQLQALIVFGTLALLPGLLRPAPPAPPAKAEPDRSPVDVVLSSDEKYLLTANQTSATVSVVEIASGKVCDEAPCGQKPSALDIYSDGKAVQVLVTGTDSHNLTAFTLEGGKLRKRGELRVPFEPRGVAISPDGRTAYVAQSTAHTIAVIDLPALRITDRIAVGRWPRYLTLSPDGKRLAVGANADGGVSVVDTAARKMLFQENFAGLNFGQMHASHDGKYVYFPWTVYRLNPTTPSNIREGWVLATRIARVRLDEKLRREAISLDPRGEAISDPHGLALSPDEKWMVCSASGTHELLVYRTAGLPFQDYGGPGDHINPQLLKDKDRFYRIPLGGRPMTLRFGKDGKTVYVANYLLNGVQVVDIHERKVVRTLSLGGPKEPSLARKGEAIFYDGRRSLDQWYSCHSCHYEGHINSVTMDTRNDGSFGTYKTVLSLRNVTHTGPWTWHGWQKSLDDAVVRSVTDTMLGKRPDEDDVKAVVAFMDTLRVPPNPHRNEDGTLTESARRGEKVYKGEKAGCARCHSGPYLTDGKIHGVGLDSPRYRYKGFNTPSLLGIYDRVLFLHDGRSATLEEMLTGPHDPARVTGQGELTAEERRDLIEYLKSL
jgi:DNA-binding beta-propeller fold protein YncE